MIASTFYGSDKTTYLDPIAFIVIPLIWWAMVSGIKAIDRQRSIKRHRRMVR